MKQYFNDKRIRNPAYQVSSADADDAVPPTAKRPKTASTEQRWERMESRQEKNSQFMSVLAECCGPQANAISQILALMQQRQALDVRKLALKEKELEQKRKESEHRMRMAERQNDGRMF